MLDTHGSALALRPPTRRTATILALTALVSVLVLCVNRVHNGDVYLQLLGGRFIAEHGFALHDPFPTIAAGQPWDNQQWLAEYAMYATARAVGLTGLTIVYALLLGLPLLLLLVHCRDRRPLVLVAGAAFYFPALLAILHPRAAGLTLVCFTLLVLLVLRDLRSRRALAATFALFALWTNLHAGFISGLALLALVAVGGEIDRRRGLAAAGVRRLAVPAALALAATLATPLGPAVWSYVASFRNPALTLATTEWESALQSPPALVYLVLSAAFALLLFRGAERPRRITPLLVTAGFIAAAALSIRNIIFIPPALFVQIASSPRSRARSPLAVPAVTAIAATAAAGVWALLGPARTPGYLGSSAVSYALRHPPKRGRLASIAGIGSYVLWRSPRTPVVIDGWLEHFTPAELRATYGLVRGAPGTLAAVDRFRIGGVITRSTGAARLLERHGFVVAATGKLGAYLVRGPTR